MHFRILNKNEINKNIFETFINVISNIIIPDLEDYMSMLQGVVRIDYKNNCLYIYKYQCN